VRRCILRALAGAACLLGACLVAVLPDVSAASARSVPLHERAAPGLSPTEAAALQRVGAFGDHPVHFLLVGDSIALTLGMGLAVDARSQYGVVVSDHATVGCDLDPQLPVFVAGVMAQATQGCVEWRALWPFLVAAERPQVVALGLGRWEVADHFYEGRWVHVGEPVWDQHLVGDLESAVSILHSFGARVVLFTMPYVDPRNRQPDGDPWSENDPARARAYNALVAEVARAEPAVVSVIDLNRMLSRDGGYAASLDGVDVRTSDGIHITLAGGELLRRQILPAVDRIGVEDEAAAGSRA